MARADGEERPSCGLFTTLALLGAMGPLAVEICIPSLPSMQESLHTSPSLVLLTLSSYLAAFATLQLIIGPISDVVGRRPILLSSLTTFVVASILAALSPSIYFLLPTRAMQAFGASSAMVLSTSVLRDKYGAASRERIASNLAPIRSTAPLLAPVLGSFLEATFGWRSCFFFLAAYGLLSLVRVWGSLPESLPEDRRQPRLRCGSLLSNSAYVLRRREFLCYALPECAGFGGLFFWISSSSFILQEFYLIPVEYFGLLYSMTFVGAILGSFSSRRLRLALHLTPPQYYLVLSAVNAVAGLVLLVFAFTPLSVSSSVASQAWLQAGMFCYTVCSSATMVQGQVQALEPFPTRAGAAAGIMGTMRSGVSCAVSVAAGQIHSHLGHTPRPICVAISVMGCLKLLLHLLCRPASHGVSAEAPSKVLVSTSRVTQSSGHEVENSPEVERQVAELKEAHEAALRDMEEAAARTAKPASLEVEHGRRGEETEAAKA
ncbi:hypothetical protein AB1Y20_002154 [Prymnesium parvum]|uniref:Major facilitator superfamily (MFS) profile domain-containing protein n=1 Tax=Prymnesium parvum TaxID=97485 RepID=A0AB34J8B5_PRYPA